MSETKLCLLLIGIFFVLLCDLTAQTTEPSACSVYLLKRAGAAPEIEVAPLQAGGVRVFPVNSTSPNLDLILPVGPGQSGNLIRTAESYSLIARCMGDEIRLQVRRPDGSTRDLTAVKTADLAAYNIRVSVIGGDGSRRAFLLAGQKIQADENGPIVDMFQGQISLKPGEYIVSTDTTVRRTAPSVEGEVPLTYRQGWLMARVAASGQGEGNFILDTASTGTEVAKVFLTGNPEIFPAQAHEHSALGSRLIEQKVTGAGGTIDTFLGHAKLPELDVGGTHFPAVTVGVLAEPVTSGQDSVLGILGMDLLLRADVVSFSYPRPGLAKIAAVFGSRSTLSGDGVIELPFFLIRGLIFVRAEINGKTAFFVLDTGARDSVMTPAAASAIGLVGDAKATRQVHGADDRSISMLPATLRQLGLGHHLFREVPVNIADLAILKTFGVQDLAGVLGNSFLSRFEKVEIDFRARVVRLLYVSKGTGKSRDKATGKADSTATFEIEGEYSIDK